MSYQYEKGKYKWKLRCGDKLYTHVFDLSSTSTANNEEVMVEEGKGSLKIYVASDRFFPLSIFLKNTKGEHIDYQYWEPNQSNFSLSLDLKNISSQEVKLEIIQSGKLLYSHIHTTNS